MRLWFTLKANIQITCSSPIFSKCFTPISTVRPTKKETHNSSVHLSGDMLAAMEMAANYTAMLCKLQEACPAATLF